MDKFLLENEFHTLSKKDFKKTVRSMVRVGMSADEACELSGFMLDNEKLIPARSRNEFMEMVNDMVRVGMSVDDAMTEALFDLLRQPRRRLSYAERLADRVRRHSDSIASTRPDEADTLRIQ